VGASNVTGFQSSGLTGGTTTNPGEGEVGTNNQGDLEAKKQLNQEFNTWYSNWQATGGGGGLSGAGGDFISRGELSQASSMRNAFLQQGAQEASLPSITDINAFASSYNSQRNVNSQGFPIETGGGGGGGWTIGSNITNQISDAWTDTKNAFTKAAEEKAARDKQYATDKQKWKDKQQWHADNPPSGDLTETPVVNTDTTQVSGMQSMQVPQIDLGASTGAVGSRSELQGMLSSYLGRSSLIQSAQRQKSIFTIDRFDGGLNQNKSPRDLAYWESPQMDCMAPSKVGRLVRLGDFSAKISASGADGLEGLMPDGNSFVENYGLFYFKLSDSLDASAAFAGESPTTYAAIQDGNDINIWNFGNSSGTNDTLYANIISSFQDTSKPVFHSAANRVYISDASFNSSVTTTKMFGIADRRKLFPMTDGTSVTYNVASNSDLHQNEELYHAAPVKGVDAKNIMVTGTQTDSTAVVGFSNTSGGVDGIHDGIYININFENIDDGDASGTGWGGTASTGDAAVKYYKFYASYLYDDGSETKLTDVTSADNAVGDDKVKATTGSNREYQKLVVKQVLIDGLEFYTNYSRVHGARFYYTEVNSDGDPIGNDKYQWAELDFRYGFKLQSEFGNWHLFEDDNGTSDGSTASDLTSIQVVNAANTGDDTSPEGTLSINTPPTAFTYYVNNLFFQEELKDDLMWKTSTVGNGIAFIGNIKYDGREYPDTMLYSGAGETDSGSAYPMWGTFPVDSNRIDIPGAAGSITALKWVKGRVLQFRQNSLYVINVEDVLSPSVEGVYQGMGVHGQWAVTETPFGCAWVNDTGVYAYNAEEGKARSLTIGRIDTEDFQSGGANLDKTKIGYDDRAKMLIITNNSNNAATGYHYAYSFVTDSWCTWNGSRAHAAGVKTNFAIDHDGYLTGANQDSTTVNIYKWSAEAQSAAAIEYITKDIDFGKPNLDKRFYTLYISFTGGSGQSNMYVYFRVNGMEGTDLTNGWTQLSSIEDYTNPYGSNSGAAWATTGSPTTGDPVVPTAVNDLDSTDTGDVQKLAKINLRHLSGSLPADYLKFARSIQFRIAGTAATTFEINDISLVFKEKRIK
jgi:hypothetical protein